MPAPRSLRNDFATDTYLAAKAHWKGTTYRKNPRSKANSNDNNPGAKDRDPQLLSFVLVNASQDFGWKREIEQARLISDWAEFIGESTAEHTQIIDIRDGEMRIQCDSTAWATELRRLRVEILNRITHEYRNAQITEMKFLGPGAPSWKHGPKSVPGRGPRDTYG